MRGKTKEAKSSSRRRSKKAVSLLPVLPGEEERPEPAEADEGDDNDDADGDSEDADGEPTSPCTKRPKAITIEDASSTDSGVSGFPSLASGASVYNLRVDAFEEAFYEQHLRCSSPLSGTVYTVRLAGVWATTPARVGKPIRIIDPCFLDDNVLRVDSERGLVVVDAGLLVPCTSVVQGVYCARKAILNNRFRRGNSASKPLLIGRVVHSLFQIAVRRKPMDLNSAWLLDVWRRELSDGAFAEMIALGITNSQMEVELSQYADSIVEWAGRHMPPPWGANEALASGSFVQAVADIEDNLWDTTFGIKGKIDISLYVKRKEGRMALEPLELKTGKSAQSVEHTGQVLLYCLALSSRSANMGLIGNGSVVYLRDGAERKVEPSAADLKGVIHLRNEIASFLGDLSENSLPAPLWENRWCSRCEHALTCTLLQRTVETSSRVSDSMAQLSTALTAHLSAAHLEYFRKWVRWIFMEWTAVNTGRHGALDLWTSTADERAKRGTCAPDLMVVSTDCKSFETTLVRLRRKSDAFSPWIFSKDDMVIVSSDTQLAFSMGRVFDVHDAFIEILLESGLSHINAGASFILDKYEGFNVQATNLGNLVSFMDPSDHMSKLRSLVVDLKEPTFAKVRKGDILTVGGVVKQLNSDQARAVLRAIVADDFVVIQGLPGSGKTSTVVALIRCLLLLGRSVLVTSYTHSAVDNLLLKLLETVSSNDVLRLGRNSSVRPELRCLTLDAKLDGYEGEERYARLTDILKETPVVGCTCLAVASDILFSLRRFSVTVVDEASLAVEASLLPAIAASDCFVLVGDSLQLSPLVQSRDARDEGMAVSLLERLSVHQSATVTLRSQYRMNRWIAKLSSSLFYEGNLTCANECIANAHLDALLMENVDIPSLSDALHACASVCASNSVVFVDTQSARSEDCRVRYGTSPLEVFNDGEIRVVSQMCELFLKLGVQGEDIGVISFYRFHATMLRKAVDSSIEVNTVDQYQGRDKRLVVVSLVWTEGGDRGHSELLSDKRRVNVAITRAKHKLIVVGCRSSMLRYPTMTSLLELIPESQVVTVGAKEG